MNGFLDYLPFIADCERGVGEPKKAIEVAVSDDASICAVKPRLKCSWCTLALWAI